MSAIRDTRHKAEMLIKQEAQPSVLLASAQYLPKVPFSYCIYILYIENISMCINFHDFYMTFINIWRNKSIQ